MNNNGKEEIVTTSIVTTTEPEVIEPSNGTEEIEETEDDVILESYVFTMDSSLSKS